MVSKWETLESKKVDDLKIFDVSWIKRRHPQWKKEGNFVMLNSPKWVNIIPITEAGNVVLIEQYRHGIDDVTIEVPGGLVELEEAPRHAGERECREETGYVGSNEAILLGENYPNPAFLNNKCYSYAWFNCKKTVEQSLDRHEDINVIEVSLSNINKMISDKKIQHSLVLTAFFFYFLKYD